MQEARLVSNPDAANAPSLTIDGWGLYGRTVAGGSHAVSPVTALRGPLPLWIFLQCRCQ